ncbi:hypothetical protein B9Z55_015384 [Caenorhabditis nigoni]|uniref:Uncharacterized protein n=1 Tax=Caenorhabditis nigoni TaxID=1611254 RepID=A0A2G5UA11_9PELO|nr:hypothetical protein B9Z55_015384 [Caenorhabditis nigoni]
MKLIEISKKVDSFLETNKQDFLIQILKITVYLCSASFNLFCFDYGIVAKHLPIRERVNTTSKTMINIIIVIGFPLVSFAFFAASCTKKRNKFKNSGGSASRTPRLRNPPPHTPYSPIEIPAKTPDSKEKDKKPEEPKTPDTPINNEEEKGAEPPKKGAEPPVEPEKEVIVEKKKELSAEKVKESPAGGEEEEVGGAKNKEEKVEKVVEKSKMEDKEKKEPPQKSKMANNRSGRKENTKSQCSKTVDNKEDTEKNGGNTRTRTEDQENNEKTKTQ